MYSMLLKVHCSSFSAVSTGTLNWPMVDIFQNKDELLDRTVPWPTKIRGRICHIWRTKLRGQFFKRTRQSEGRVLYYVLVGFVYSAIFLPKRQNQITFRTMSKNFNMKNIKMRPPVPLFDLFKKSGLILYLFLKVTSHIIKTGKT